LNLRKIGLGILVIFLMVTSLWAALISYTDALKSEKVAERLVAEQKVGGQALDSLKMALTGNSEIAFMASKRNIIRRSSWRHFYEFLGLSVLTLLLAGVGTGKSRLLLFVGMILTICAGVLGIITPSLVVEAQQHTPIGSISLFYEARGIGATVLQLLGPGGSLIVGIPLLAFSIVMPFLKTVLLSVALVSSNSLRPRVMNFVKRVGRWSMADVFVVALLLSFFASNHNQFIDASLLPGIAFFAYYAVASLVLAARIEAQS
jgi:paraquat-inducible protein A